MRADQNKLIVRRYYEEVVGLGRVDSIKTFVALECTEVYRNVRHPLGVGAGGITRWGCDVRSRIFVSPSSARFAKGSGSPHA